MYVNQHGSFSFGSKGLKFKFIVEIHSLRSQFKAFKLASGKIDLDFFSLPRERQASCWKLFNTFQLSRLAISYGVNLYVLLPHKIS